VAGASVTSNDAGLSVPDWPLSYGKVMPPMTGGIFYEHGHRMIASTVGFMTIIMAIWLWQVERRVWMKRLGLAAVGGVVLQGVLGGMTVLFLLPKGVSIAHACLAELFFCTTVAIALFTSPSWMRGPQLVLDEGSPSLRSLAILTPACILVQIALGASYRHHLVGIMPHILGALAVSAVILYFAMSILSEYKDHETLRKSAKTLMHIVFLQVFLGIAAYLSRISTSESLRPMPLMVGLTVAHVAVGALTLAAGVVLAIQVRRNVRPASGEAYQAA
jgi:cytochrome c oxidase assembly protein subunit 15